MRDLRAFALILLLLCIVPATATADGESQAGNDSVLTAKVKSALASDRAVRASNIEVQTRNGVVQLSGFVSSEGERSAAVLRARSVAGVSEVRNDLGIRAGGRPPR